MKGFDILHRFFYYYFFLIFFSKIQISCWTENVIHLQAVQIGISVSSKKHLTTKCQGAIRDCFSFGSVNILTVWPWHMDVLHVTSH